MKLISSKKSGSKGEGDAEGEPTEGNDVLGDAGLGDLGELFSALDQIKADFRNEFISKHELEDYDRRISKLETN